MRQKNLNQFPVSLFAMLAFIMFWLQPVLSFSQQVAFEGRITDWQGNPVDSALVIIHYKGSNWNTTDSVLTDAGGNYSTVITGLERGETIPENYELISPNYPNPFNPGTVIPVSQQVDRLKVYNALGQKIIETDGPRRGGWTNKKVVRSLASGIYFIVAVDERTGLRKTIKSVLTDGGQVTFTFRTYGTSASSESPVTTLSKRTVTDSIRYSIIKSINNQYDIIKDTTITYNGENPLIKDFRLPVKTITIKYQDAGTKEPIKGDSIIIKNLITGEEYARLKTNEQGTTNTEIPTNTTITLKFFSPDSNYLIYNDTLNTNNIPDTLIEEGIKNLPVNTEYWQGFKEYMWFITGAKFDPEGRRFSHWKLDSIPVYIPEKITPDGIDWKQRFIDSVITPLNNLVRSPEKQWDAVYVTTDSLLAENQGIRIIYDSNNLTVTHHLDPDDAWLISNAEIYWLIRAPPDDERSDFEGMHELYLHGMIGPIHSPDPQDLFHGPPATNFQPYEKYVLQIVWNKREKNLKGYEDY